MTTTLCVGSIPTPASPLNQRLTRKSYHDCTTGCTYVGIDNGLDGGLCALSHHPDSLIVAMIPMPTCKVDGTREIDVVAIWRWLDQLGRSKLVAIIERPTGSKSSTAARSMAGSFHSLRTIMEIKGVRYHRVTPQKWQKPMLGNCGAGNTKPAALSLARNIWPDETFLKTERCSVPHDGMIDAALISEWARRNSL